MKDYPFPFQGDEIALDLTNTEVIVRGKRRDLLAASGDLARWWSEALRQHPDISTPPIAFDGDALETVRRLRGALREIFIAVISKEFPVESAVATLNGSLDMGSLVLRFDSKGNPLSTYEPRAGDLEQVLLIIALSAHRLLTESTRERLRQCDNERCMMLFYDNTRNGARRWCSTACMDRMRSAERYKLVKQSQTP